MNERIKELMDQAGIDVEAVENLGEMPTALKFAELIVKECMAIADEQKKYVEDMEVFNEQDATWNKARIQQSQQIVDKIKQHFGVEE
jgi:hypothetical protein